MLLNLLINPLICIVMHGTLFMLLQNANYLTMFFVILMSLTFSEELDPRSNSLSVGCFKAKSTGTWFSSDKGSLIIYLLIYLVDFGDAIYIFTHAQLYYILSYAGAGDQSRNFSKCS